jgi:hypothetical protein
MPGLVAGIHVFFWKGVNEPGPVYAKTSTPRLRQARKPGNDDMPPKRRMRADIGRERRYINARPARPGFSRWMDFGHDGIDTIKQRAR